MWVLTQAPSLRGSACEFAERKPKNGDAAARRAGVGAPYNVGGCALWVDANSPDGLLRFCAAARNAGVGVPYRACTDSPQVEASRSRVLRGRRGRRPLHEPLLSFFPLRFTVHDTNRCLLFLPSPSPSTTPTAIFFSFCPLPRPRHALLSFRPVRLSPSIYEAAIPEHIALVWPLFLPQLRPRLRSEPGLISGSQASLYRR